MDDATTVALSEAVGVPVGHFAPAAVARRLAALAPDGLDELARRARTDARLRARARRAVVNSQTGMFRDPRQFALLRDELLPRLTAGGRRMTVWSAGCSDGAELASVAVLLAQRAEVERPLLLGSDLLEENIRRARERPADPALPRLRWERRDIVAEGPPRGRWRLVVCRNVAIHLRPPARVRLHDAVVDALAADGVLLLGRSERLADASARGLVRIGPNAYARRR